MKNLRGRLTYANVISTLCLFMLLGGGAYAAGQLPKNSVGTKQLKNNAITGQKIKNGTIDSSKLTPATATTLKGTQGERGAVGPQGAQGPQGPQGLAGDPGAYATVVAEFPPVFLGSHPGFSAVDRVSTGIYCLVPSAETDISHPIAAPDWADSAGSAFFIEPLAGEAVSGCEEGELEVHTTELQKEPDPRVPIPTNDASFSVFAPGA